MAHYLRELDTRQSPGVMDSGLLAQCIVPHPLPDNEQFIFSSIRAIKAVGTEQALEVFAAMWQQGMVPEKVTYNAMISACGEGKQPE